MEPTQHWFDAAEADNVGTLQKLLADGVDINASLQGQTALLIAVCADAMQAVRFLLEQGAKPDIVDGQHFGATPLMYAASGGNVAIVRLLLQHGATVDVEDSRRDTAVTYGKEHSEIVKFLVDAGARPVPPKTVIVMGAGFTRGFVPTAPTLIGPYAVRERLAIKYVKFRTAHDILTTELERQAHSDGEDRGNVNLERLMTRLASGMPYDEELGEPGILNVLLAELKAIFIEEIQQAVKRECHWEELDRLAKVCLQDQITCITYNYDDIFDQALRQESELSQRDGKAGYEWDPNSGYGFYCRPSANCVSGFIQNPMSATALLLLKLHGSMNWRVRRGTVPPYRVDDILHHINWQAHGVPPPRLIMHGWTGMNQRDSVQRLEQHLDATPVIVPPILTKSELKEQPLLRLLWSLAYEAIKNAEELIFVGYSLPMTDIAAAFLFSEATKFYPNRPRIHVVDFANDGDENHKNRIKASYREIFSDLNDSQFDFRGTRAWAADFVQSHQRLTRRSI
jgi:hypothetical protein